MLLVGDGPAGPIPFVEAAAHKILVGDALAEGRLSTGILWPKPWMMNTASGWIRSVTLATVVSE